MCSSGNPFLCCGKSNRQRCVPLTSLIQSSAPDSCAAATRVPATDRPAAAAAPIIRPMKLRRCKSEVEYQFFVSSAVFIQPPKQHTPHTHAHEKPCAQSTRGFRRREHNEGSE